MPGPDLTHLPTQPSTKDTLPRPPLRYWAWLKFWTFHGQRALLWWVGFLFLIGAFLFTFVGITEVIPVIVNDASGLTSKAAWLVYYPGAVGAICFFWTASLVNFIEVGAGRKGALQPQPPHLDEKTATCVV